MRSDVDGARSSRNAWLSRSRRRTTARLRLFCFPYAGGSASIFQEWLTAASPAIEVCPVHLPGRGSRLADPAMTDAAELADAAAAALLEDMTVPFALFGYSMGAVVAFEVARRVRTRTTCGPVHLFVAARPGPSFRDPDLRHRLPDAELIQALRDLNGTPGAVFDNTEMLQLLLPTIRADLKVCETYAYAPAPPLDCAVTVFGGTEDEQVTPEHLALWRNETRGPCALHMLPGDHFFLHTHGGALLRAIERELQPTFTAGAAADSRWRFGTQQPSSGA
jgi:medium-chain acyl-[acyl-carrier-protein] hydrolase